MLLLYRKDSKADFDKSKIFLQLTEDMPSSQEDFHPIRFFKN